MLRKKGFSAKQTAIDGADQNAGFSFTITNKSKGVDLKGGTTGITCYGCQYDKG